jgi:hypothetical protein
MSRPASFPVITFTDMDRFSLLTATLISSARGAFLVVALMRALRKAIAQNAGRRPFTRPLAQEPLRDCAVAGLDVGLFQPVAAMPAHRVASSRSHDAGTLRDLAWSVRPFEATFRKCSALPASAGRLTGRDLSHEREASDIVYIDANEQDQHN